MSGEAETFFCGFIGKSVTEKYVLTLKQKLTTERETIPSRCRIGGKCLLLCLSLEVISSAITPKIRTMFIKTLSIFVCYNKSGK